MQIANKIKRFLISGAILLLLTTAFGRVTAFAEPVPAEADHAQKKKEASATKVIPENPFPYVPVYYGTKVLKNNVYRKNARIPVNWISQLPEYPNGCELTTLTMALNYCGFAVDKNKIARKYFITKERKQDFRYYYVGNPSDYTGLGCYPPALVKIANAYLSRQHTHLHAFDYTNTPFEALLNQVADGHPVIIWASINMGEPYYGYRVKIGDEDLAWISQEHCLLLTGYDLSKNTVTFCDPLVGIVEYNMNLVKKRYTQLGFRAVIIKNSLEKIAEDKDILFWPFNDRFLAADHFVRGCKGFDGVFEAG